jgi:hypothetical protein
MEYCILKVLVFRVLYFYNILRSRQSPGTRWAEELEGSVCQPNTVHDLNAMFPRAHFEGKFLVSGWCPVVLFYYCLFL